MPLSKGVMQVDNYKDTHSNLEHRIQNNFTETETSEDKFGKTADSKGKHQVMSYQTNDPKCPRTLYWGSGSPAAWRVRLYLEERGLAYKSKLISFQNEDLKTPEMLALNPRGLVPIYIDDDSVMYESLAIITFLEMHYGNKFLSSSNQRKLSRSLMRMHEVNNASAFVGEVVYYIRRTNPTDINELYLSAKRDAMYREISLWERYFDSGDDFLVGSEISVADIVFFPTLAYIVRLGFDLSSRFPRLNSFYKRMKKRRSVKASWPPHWLDGPGVEPLRGL